MPDPSYLGDGLARMLGDCLIAGGLPFEKGMGMTETIRALWHDEDGVTTVEYALMLVVLVVGAAAVWVALRGAMTSGVNAASAELTSS